MKIIIQPLKSHWYGVAFLLFITGFIVSSCDTTGNDNDNTPSPVEYAGDFIASSDTVNTSASGTTTATYDPETGEVSYVVEWQGLSSPVFDMHFHNAGGVIHGIEGWEADTAGSVSGTVIFSADEADDLAAGQIYTQIHTETYPSGEVIAPLTRSGSTNNGDNNNNDGGGTYDY